jgi:hypothetical protein
LLSACLYAFLQLCWCLAQLAVVPPQSWLDDFADTAAVHVIAARKQQQQQQQRHQGTAGSTSDRARSAAVGPASNKSSVVSEDAAAAAVKLWQLQVMHFVLIRCWRYRAGHAVGKLQFRLVRELNRVSWSVRMLPQQQQQQQGQHHQQQQQQQQGKLQELDARVWRQFHRMRRQKRAMLGRQLGTLQQQKARQQQQRKGRQTRQEGQQKVRSSAGLAAAAAGGVAQDAAQPGQTGQQHKQKAQQQQLSSASKMATGRGINVGGQRGMRQREAVVSAARQLAVLQMRQRAAAVWPRQWEPVCLAVGDCTK